MIFFQAVASIENYGKKSEENLHTLISEGVFPFIIPLIESSDNLIRRFTLKLIAMLCSIEEFRKELLKLEHILDTFIMILNTVSA